MQQQAFSEVFLFQGHIYNIKSLEPSCKQSFVTYTAQKMKFFIKDFFSECDQIRSFLRIWSHLLKKSLM